MQPDRLLTLAAVTALALLLLMSAGCGSSGGGFIPEGTEDYVFTIDSDSITIETGESTQLELSLYDSGNNFLDGVIVTLDTWEQGAETEDLGTLSNNAVELTSQDPHGTVSPIYFNSLGAGTAIVHATYEGGGGNILAEAETEIIIASTLHSLDFLVDNSGSTVNTSIGQTLTLSGYLYRGGTQTGVLVDGPSIYFTSYEQSVPGVIIRDWFYPYHTATAYSQSTHGLDRTYTWIPEAAGTYTLKAVYRNGIGQEAATDQVTVVVSEP